MITAIMKIEIKHRLTDVVLFSHECEGNTMKITVEKAVKEHANLLYADLQWANLQWANLQGAGLREANLQGATLQGATLQGATLQGADLREANLRGANLREANLQWADLQGADLDFSCLTFSCKSLNPKTNEKQRIQLAYHLLSWMKNADNLTDEERIIYEQVRSYANKFHRDDVERLPELKIESNQS
jgi:hypothetical protein